MRRNYVVVMMEIAFDQNRYNNVYHIYHYYSVKSQWAALTSGRCTITRVDIERRGPTPKRALLFYHCIWPKGAKYIFGEIFSLYLCVISASEHVAPANIRETCSKLKLNISTGLPGKRSIQPIDISLCCSLVAVV